MTKEQLRNCNIELREKIFKNNTETSSLLDDLHAAFCKKMYDIPHWYSYIEKNITKYHKEEKEMIVIYAKHLCNAARSELNGEESGCEAQNFIIWLLGYARNYYKEKIFPAQFIELSCLEMYYLKGIGIDSILSYLQSGGVSSKFEIDYDHCDERYAYRYIERGRYHLGVVACCFMYEFFYKKLSHSERFDLYMHSKNHHNKYCV